MNDEDLWSQSVTVNTREVLKTQDTVQCRYTSVTIQNMHQELEQTPSTFLRHFYTMSQKKTVQICFCQNLVKFPPILIIFWQKDGKEVKIV